MSAQTAAVSSLTPALLKQFLQDFEIVRSELPAARLNLQAEKDKANAEKTLRRTRVSRLKVGEALRRMHDSESYQNKYGKDWSALCRALKIRRQESYELMADADLFKGMDPKNAEAIAGSLSSRDLLKLRKADPEERDHAVAEAVRTGETKAAFAPLMASLAAAPAAALDEGVAPKPDKSANRPSMVKRILSTLTNVSGEEGLLEEVFTLPAKPTLKIILDAIAGRMEAHFAQKA